MSSLSRINHAILMMVKMKTQVLAIGKWIQYWILLNGSDEQHYKSSKKSIIKYVPWSQARSRWHASRSPALVNIDSQSSTCEVCERQDYSLICCSIMSQNKDLDLAFLLLDFFITIISVAHSTSSQKYLRISTILKMLCVVQKRS